MDKESDSFQIEKVQPIAFVWFFANFLPGNAYKNVVYIKKKKVNFKIYGITTF